MAECLMGLRVAEETDVLYRDNGWVDVAFTIGLDPSLVEWISQHDMTPQSFALDFLSDAIDVFKLYLDIYVEDNNSVKE